MANKAKVEMVEKIKGEIADSDAIWVVDYRGLTVKPWRIIGSSTRGGMRDSRHVMSVFFFVYRTC